MRTGTIKSRSYAHGLDALQTHVTGESMTRQDQADLCNINVIYKKTQRGEIVLASEVMPQYGDFSNVNSYDRMLEMINEAEEAFLELSAEERKKYNHDPAEYYRRKHEEASALVDKLAKEEADFEKSLADKKALEDAHKLIEKNQKSAPES